MTELMKSCNFLLFYSWVEIQIAPAHLHFLKRCCLRIDVVAASMSAKRNSASAVLLLKLLTSWQKSVEEFFSDVKTFVCSVLCLLASLSFSCFDSNLQQSLPEIQRREFESLSSVTTLHFSAGKSLFLLEVSRFWSAVDSVPSSVNVFLTNSGEVASSLFAELLSFAHSAFLSRPAAEWNSSCYKRQNNHLSLYWRLTSSRLELHIFTMVLVSTETVGLSKVMRQLQ